MSNISRRRLLGTVGLGTVGGLLAGSQVASETAFGKSNIEDVNWRYVPLAPESVAAEAYRIMLGNGCMYGAFMAIFETWQKVAGVKVVFPAHMMRYGERGVGGWGTVCGTLNGGAAAIGLFVQEKRLRQALIGELFSWYENTSLPVFQPKGSPAIAPSKAESVLCHISVFKWQEKIDEKSYNDELREERCRRLTADVAAKTVEILNKHQQEFTANANPPKQAAKPPTSKVFGKMKCCICHGEDNP